MEDEFKLLREADADLCSLIDVLAKSGCAGVGGDLIDSIRRKIAAYIRARQAAQP